MIVFAVEYSEDGAVVPYSCPGHPDDPRIFADFKKDIKRREKAGKSMKAKIRDATPEELKQWNIQVPV